MARKQALTEKEIITRREELASLDKEQLSKLSRDRLRELCTGCLDYSSKDKKDILIEKILAWTEPLRLEKLAAIAVIREELGSSNAAISPEEIKQIVKKVNPKAAAQVLRSRMISQLYSESSITKTYSPRIIKIINSMADLDAEYKDAFQIALRYENREDTKAVNEQYKRETVPGYSSDRRLVDFNWVLNWAQKQLIERKSWKLVTLALTLTSGRRPVEIHCTGSFKIVNNPNKDIPEYPITKGWLSFSGQAKEKENMKYKEAVGTYTIPLLVDTELWLNAYEWLVEQGKTGVTKEKLNKNYSKEVSIIVKSVFAETGINKWYDCRDFYAAAYRGAHSMMESKGSAVHKKKSAETVLSRLLGHGEQDITTQQSYGKMTVVF